MYVLLPAASAFTTTAELFRPWNALRAAVGEPLQRAFLKRKTRLFGAKEPDVIFWRDSAGWCPFCEIRGYFSRRCEYPTAFAPFLYGATCSKASKGPRITYSW